MKGEPSTTYLGRVQEIKGFQAHIRIDESIPLTNRGAVEDYRIGQVGSFVKIPLHFLDVYGIVSAAGTGTTVSVDNRWVQVQLIGESDRKGNFFRGVSVLPTFDDDVHLATLEDMSLIYGKGGASYIPFGMHATAQGLPAYIDLDKLLTRHGMIVGSTGSGKSNAVAGLLRAISAGNFPNGRVVVIDPHGEYSAAVKSHAKVFSIRDAVNPLLLPYWALSFDELAWFLVERHTATESQQDKILRDKIYDEKRKSHQDLKAGALAEYHISPDSPVPFDLKKVWYDLYFDEHATYLEKSDLNKIAYKVAWSGTPRKGDPLKAIAPEFEIASDGTTPPYPSPKRAGMAVYLNKIFLRLKDRSYDFLLNPGDYDGKKKDLSDLLESWLSHDKVITVFNLEGVPFEIMDLAVGAITKLLFNAMVWGRELRGVGRQRPLLIVYEEAHAYLSRAEVLPFLAGYSRQAVRRILKEGRKYGIGAVVVTQRPSELDTTLFSESGTYIALRLTNSQDQALVKSVLPDSLGDLMEQLPGLRTGEAIMVGEAVRIPSRVHLPLIEPRPNSSDAEPVKNWKEPAAKNPQYAETVTAWRKQQQTSDSTP